MEILVQDTILTWQKSQYGHDRRNHFDIVSRHKVDRFKHYGLHFAKYAGRLARGENESGKTKQETAIDSILVSLSSSNTLPHRLTEVKLKGNLHGDDALKAYTAWMGIYCDAVEKIDHAEFDDIRSTLAEANQAIFDIALNIAWTHNHNICDALERRRAQLASRAFFAGD